MAKLVQYAVALEQLAGIAPGDELFDQFGFEINIARASHRVCSTLYRQQKRAEARKIRLRVDT